MRCYKKLKRSPKTIIYIMLIVVLLVRLFESLGVPHAVIFILDVFNCILVANLIVSGKINKWYNHVILKCQILIFLVGIFSAIMHFVSPVLIIWALRNLLRFNIFYFACAEFLNIEDVIDIFRIFKIFFYLNFILIMFQYMMGYSGDYLGGIFGTTQGANSYMNIFLLIISAYEVAMWMVKKEKFGALALTIGISLVECLLCELKVYFVEIVLIVVMAFVVNMYIEKKRSLLIKILGLGVLLFVVLIIAIKILGEMYPNFANFFTIEGILHASTREGGYSNSGDLNRLTAIKTINEKIFRDGFTRIFGLGLGSTEFSSAASFLTSDFYEKYNYLKYYWFSTAWMYLECGYIGLIGYITSFYLLAIKGIRLAKRMRNNRCVYAFIITACILCFMTMVLYLYNQSLRLEISYLLYFCFAIICVGGSEENAK